VAAANIGNSLGDAIGYHWGQRLLEERWQEFVRARDKTGGPL
jgi:membrane protein DedA with SNARE-associated domain